jgi:hypothetical protein
VGSWCLPPCGRARQDFAEDSHQRIYGTRAVLGRYGVAIVGRSQRLTLNYRTTAQNLQYAMTFLEGGDYVDLEGDDDATGYRSTRSGPAPAVESVDSLADELHAIVRRVGDWLQAGKPPTPSPYSSRTDSTGTGSSQPSPRAASTPAPWTATGLPPGGCRS